MDYGLLAVILVQVCLALVCTVASVRLWNIQSGYEREQAVMESRLATSEMKIDLAKGAVFALETSHYKALQTRQLGLETDVQAWRIKVDSLAESQASLSAKLASREKLERKANEKMSLSDVVDKNLSSNVQMSIEDLIASGQAKPLQPDPEVKRVNGSFGKKVG